MTQNRRKLGLSVITVGKQAILETLAGKSMASPPIGSHVEKEREARSFVAAPEEKENPSSSEPNLFSKEQFEWLQKMFNQNSNIATTISTGSATQKGIFSATHHVKTEDSARWIVDSGASDHMTGDASLFQECYPCLKDYKVQIDDGSLSLVTGIGKVVISNTLTLQSVLLVL